MAGNRETEVCIIGLGYVGITLAAAFLQKGMRVYGVESQEHVRQQLAQGRIHLREPGVAEIIQASVAEQGGRRFHVAGELPKHVATAVICVGTPYDRENRQPQLDALQQAVKQVAERITDDSLLVIRSTVPVGTTRGVVLPLLAQYKRHPRLAVAPERTIQGNALAELLSLPQVIGADDSASFHRAKELFAALGTELIGVSSYEAAELVKLVCNAYTDVRYSFANEVARIATAFGLDAHEIIAAANLRYPRPAIARPGFVGGSCLTKDPYHLLYAAAQADCQPRLIAAARAVNEALPEVILAQIERVLREKQLSWRKLRVSLSGLAYKGKPETDDLRGSIVWDLLPRLQERGVRAVCGHDFVLSDDRIRALGLQPVTLEEAFHSSDLVMLLNDHGAYDSYALEAALAGAKRLVLLYDLWGVYRQRITCLEPVKRDKFCYMGVGFGG